MTKKKKIVYEGKKSYKTSTEGLKRERKTHQSACNAWLLFLSEIVSDILHI